MPRRMKAIRHSTGVLAVLAVAACDRASSSRAPEETEHDPRAEFVVFTQPELAISRWLEPIALPVTAGSKPSPATIRSDAPEIVSIEPNGRLVAHADGMTIVRASGTGSTLRVRVAQTSSIRLVLPRRMSEGESVLARPFAEDGTELLGSSVRWSVTASEVAIVTGWGLVTARSPGRTELIGLYGGHEGRVILEVEPRATPDFTVRPANPHISIGSLVSLQAISSAGPLEATWTSSAPRIAALLGGSIVRGVQPGKAVVCARASSRRSCTTVEVIR